MKKWVITIGVCTFLLQGCSTATKLAGQAIRSGMKDIEISVTNGYDIHQFSHSRIAVSTDITNIRGMSVTAPGPGNAAISNNVYTDMIMTEFLKQGFDARAIADSFNFNDAYSLGGYRDQGFQIIVKGNLKLATSSSMWGEMTGGEASYSGVKEFTLKGIDTNSGKVIFIVTGDYGKPKEAKVVASDIADAFNDKIKRRR
ncbi:MAG: hypothetical protein Q9M17_04700 [Mariprofundus sp.]|nr:hypothetical protein [Mariprofundus sp.]